MPEAWGEYGGVGGVNKEGWEGVTRPGSPQRGF